MGYAQSGMKAGAAGVGAQFVPISGEGIDLTDIIPTGYKKDEYEGASINIQLLDFDGTMVPDSNYYWYDDAYGTSWLDFDDNEVQPGDVVFAPGEALWTEANSASESLRTSGQVADGAIDVFLRAGSKLVNNPTPIAIPFNDDNGDGNFILPGGYEYDSYEGASINVQKLDVDGTMIPDSNYYWYDDEYGATWLDFDDNEVEGVTLAPGEALWVEANGTDEKITFPGVTIK